MIQVIKYGIDRIKKARAFMPIALLLVLFILISAVPIEKIQSLFFLLPIILFTHLKPIYPLSSNRINTQILSSVNTKNNILSNKLPLLKSIVISFFIFFIFGIGKIILRRQPLLPLSMLTLIFCAFYFYNNIKFKNYGFVYRFSGYPLWRSVI